MSKSTEDLINIIKSGASVTISATSKSKDDLIAIATEIKNCGTQLVLKDCNNKSTADLLEIVAICPKQITLRFTEL